MATVQILSYTLAAIAAVLVVAYFLTGNRKRQRGLQRLTAPMGLTLQGNADALQTSGLLESNVFKRENGRSDNILAGEVRPRRHKPGGFRLRNYKIWDFETGEVLYQSPKYQRVWSKDGWLRTHYGTTVEFSKDGKYLLEVRPKIPIRIVKFNRINNTDG